VSHGREVQLSFLHRQSREQRHQMDLSQFASASLNGIIAIKEILLWLINTTKNLNARRYALR
jgi:hypothetical protein